MDTYLLANMSEVNGLIGELANLSQRRPDLGPGVFNPLLQRAEALKRFVEVPKEEVVSLLTAKELIDDYLVQIILPATGPYSSFDYFEQLGVAAELYTNLKQQSQIPWNESFKINGLAVWVYPPIIVGTSTTDVFTYFNNAMKGKWELNVGNKDYNEGYLASIVQEVVDIEIFRSQGTAADAYDHVIALNPPITKAKGYYTLPDGPTIDKSTNFVVKVTWSAAIGASNPVYVGMILYGKRIRPIR